jgi:dTDP-glucose 4,6-dehydratase
VAAAACDAAVGQTLNVGSGREIAVGDLAQLIAELAGTPIEVQSEDQRMRPERSEVDRLLADNSHARRLLGWEPRVTLEEGLRRTVDWIRQHPHKYRPDVYTV